MVSQSAVSAPVMVLVKAKAIRKLLLMSEILGFLEELTFELSFEGCLDFPMRGNYGQWYRGTQ